MNSHTTVSPLEVPSGWANAAWLFAELRHRPEITDEDWHVIIDWLKTTHFDADSRLARDVAVSLIQDRAPAAIVNQVRDLGEAASGTRAPKAVAAAGPRPRPSVAKTPFGLPGSVRLKSVSQRLHEMREFDSSLAIKARHQVETSLSTSERRRKLSVYGMALAEKQKLKYYYGLREAQLRRYFVSAKACRGNTGELLLMICERRLDNVIRRAGFTLTRTQARQGLVHRHFQLNGETVDKPSILVKPGDVITLRPRSNLAKMYREIIESGSRPPVDWIQFNAHEMEARIVNLPTAQDVSLPIDIGQLMAFMSR